MNVRVLGALGVSAIIAIAGLSFGVVIGSHGGSPEYLPSFVIQGGPLVAGPADVVAPGAVPLIPCESLGLICRTGAATDEISAFSFGTDFTTASNLPPLQFSVTSGSIGLAGSGVRDQARCLPAEPQADVFQSGLQGSNAQLFDGDGTSCGVSGGTGLGLCESSCVGGSVNVIGPAMDAAVIGLSDNRAPNTPIFLTLNDGSPSLPFLASLLGVASLSGGDILVGERGAPPNVWAGSSQLGLGASGDVIDALCIHDDGDMSFGTGDQALFSLAPGSPSLVTAGAGPADLLRPGPAIVYQADRLGLGTTDDIDGALCLADDADQDYLFDFSDNCPAVANSTQANADGDAWGDACDECPATATQWLAPPQDFDCDGFTGADETAITTDPGDACGFTAGAPGESETWPPDLVESNSVNISDVLALKPVFGTAVPPTPARYDIVPGGGINISDLLVVKPFFGKTCVP